MASRCTLPREIVLEINKHRDIGAFDGNIGKISGLSLDYLNSERNNPHAYFKQLTSATEYFLCLMRDTGSMLVKSRAAAFFYPDACTKASDWNFLCPGGWRNLFDFVHGIEVIGGTVTAVPYRRDHEYLDETRTVHMSLNGYDMTLSMAPFAFPIVFLSGSACTLTQCFITGSLAVSLFHSGSSKGLFHQWSTAFTRDWTSEPTHPDDFLSSHSKSLIERGFCKTDMRYVPVDTKALDMDEYRRKLINEESLVIVFDEYTDTTQYTDLMQLERIVSEEYDVDKSSLLEWGGGMRVSMMWSHTGPGSRPYNRSFTTMSNEDVQEYIEKYSSSTQSMFTHLVMTDRVQYWHNSIL